MFGYSAPSVADAFEINRDKSPEQSGKPPPSGIDPNAKHDLHRQCGRRWQGFSRSVAGRPQRRRRRPYYGHRALTEKALCLGLRRKGGEASTRRRFRGLQRSRLAAFQACSVPGSPGFVSPGRRGVCATRAIQQRPRPREAVSGRGLDRWPIGLAAPVCGGRANISGVSLRLSGGSGWPPCWPWRSRRPNRRGAQSRRRAPAVGAPVAVAARLVDQGGKARLTFDLSAPAEARAFSMADPDRIIVDVPEVNFQIDPAVGRMPQGGSLGQIVKSFRFGLLAPGKSRIVIDLAAPARITRVATQPIAKDAEPARLQIELSRCEPAEFLEAVRDGGPAGPSVQEAAAPRRIVRPARRTAGDRAGSWPRRGRQRRDRTGRGGRENRSSSISRASSRKSSRRAGAIAS